MKADIEGGVRFAIFVGGVQMRDWSAERITAFFDGVATAVRAHVGDSAPAPTGGEGIVALRESIMEECARAVCPWCRDGEPFSASVADHHLVKIDDTDNPLHPCAAAAIRALRAAHGLEIKGTTGERDGGVGVVATCAECGAFPCRCHLPSSLPHDPDFTGGIPTDDYARLHWKGGTLKLDSDGKAELT